MHAYTGQNIDAILVIETYIFRIKVAISIGRHAPRAVFITYELSIP
jgi:hypothetical protein